MRICADFAICSVTAALVLVVAPMAPSASPCYTPIPFEISYPTVGPDIGPVAPIYRAVRNTQEWEEVYALLRIAEIEPTAPALDFAQSTLLVASPGYQPADCPSVCFELVLDYSDTVLVFVDLIRCTTCGEDPSRPVTFAAIPRTDKAVVFKIREAWAAADHVAVRSP